MKIAIRLFMALLLLFQLVIMAGRILGYVPTDNWLSPILCTGITAFCMYITWENTRYW